MLLKYRPEDKAAKKERLLKRAQAEAEGKTSEVKKPIVVKYGLKHVTYLVEQVLIISNRIYVLVFFTLELQICLLCFLKKFSFFSAAEQGPVSSDCS